MNDQDRTYDLGQWRNGAGPRRRWEDLDEETRNQITQSLASVRETLTQALLPSIEAMRAQVAATVTPFVLNLRDWMPGLRSTWESVQHFAEFVRRWVPNWSSNLDIEKAWEITGDGIPLAFVPRVRIVEEIVDAVDHDARIAILIRLKGLVVADCRAALVPEEDDPFPESIAMLSSLLAEATKAGLEEAIAKNDFRISLSMRPLYSLIYEWWGEGDPVQTMPSRHVVAHWAHPEHLTEANAIIIVMAATSLMLGLAEREAIAQLVANESA